ncbi:6,7-dimethyl-8-ribityllumazine synthase [Pigmentiphaga aceris]|uniref:6,7-dimethyl-8-ribityllumazine synthase n=1 Tax=Pigmentiphaga aceris TaxID=1940612 RepID=A0A5C0AS97_9BURK|nr:6,7-dimethyl-8-ribityllumazine synthase [Pigmentiphaga aceris]QEI04845.1 6,7-dimethyl-8-ribityllumazine synthase [Pigmentiphaga aceris]
MNQTDRTSQHSSHVTSHTTSQASAPRIAYIQSSWHRDIVDQAHTGFVAELARQHVSADAVSRFVVPGAFEIPLHAKRLAATGQYDAIVACGFVVDGGIYRHDFVASTVVSALMDVQLATDVPVFSVVLTPHHFHEHAEHQRFFKAHFVHKGEEAATAVLGTLRSLQDIAVQHTPAQHLQPLAA